MRANWIHSGRQPCQASRQQRPKVTQFALSCLTTWTFQATLSSRTSSAISVSLGLDRAHSEVRKTGCTATQDQNIHAAAHLARLWCGGVSGPSLIRGRCNLTTEAASRFFKVDPLRSTT
ncbi:hypothetical protein CSPX01_02992 [Colletotrichum filicis]|nr:hypothetical protein CSPX01_02992 [Colletotrichum filicis]